MSVVTRMQSDATNNIDLIIDYLRQNGFEKSARAIADETLEKSIIPNTDSALETSIRTGILSIKRRKHIHGNGLRSENCSDDIDKSSSGLQFETILISPSNADKEKDPYGAAVFPLYQTATFCQV